MSSYRQILYHIVFRTKNGKKALLLENSTELYAYILGIIKNKDCYYYQINGMEDHIHILCDLNPKVALADFLRDIKTSSSIWLKHSGKFPEFDGWAEGYAALSYSWKDKRMISNYIKNQRMHHKKMIYTEELRRILKEHGVEVNEQFFP